MRTIVAILMAAAGISMGGGLVGCKRTSDEGVAAIDTQLSGFKTALNAFEVDNGRFPTTQEGLEALVHNPSGADLPHWRGPYLDKIPNDPWGHPFHYQVPAQDGRTPYGLFSCGPDGISRSNGNDPDDINNWKPTQ